MRGILRVLASAFPISKGRFHFSLAPGNGILSHLEVISQRHCRDLSTIRGEVSAGIAQIFKIRRYVKEGEKEREEIVYGFTNLPRKKANAQQLLKYNQQHWHIENRLHYRRDVT